MRDVAVISVILLSRMSQSNLPVTPPIQPAKTTLPSCALDKSSNKPLAAENAVDDFDELLRVLQQDTSETLSCESKKTLERYLSEDPGIESGSRFDLLHLLHLLGEEKVGVDQPGQTGRSTPPLEVLEQIEEEDEDKLLMDAQNNLFTWSFKHGSYIGAQYDEGEYDLDMYGEQVYSPIQGFFDKFPTYDLWWSNTFTPLKEEGMESHHNHCRPDPRVSAAMKTDPLVRFFCALLMKGLVDTFRNLFRIIYLDQMEYTNKFERGIITERDILIKKESQLLIELADSFAQVEALKRNSLPEMAFSACCEKLAIYQRAEYNLGVVTDAIIVYLYELSKACLSDNGKCQATAADLLAEYWKAKGHDLQAFKLYADVFFLAHNKPWTQSDGSKLSEAAAAQLFNYYIIWGQSQNIPLMAEDFYYKATKMANFIKREHFRAIAACYTAEVNCFLGHMDPESYRTELVDFKRRAAEEAALNEDMEMLFVWAEAMMLMSEKKLGDSAFQIPTYIKYLQKNDNCYQLHKAYRELALIYEQMRRTNVALEVFKAAWQTRQRSPALPDVDDVNLKVTSVDTIKPTCDRIDFVTYIKHVYAGIHEPERRKRALDICRTYLELKKPTPDSSTAPGFAGLLMEGDVISIDHVLINGTTSGKTEEQS